VVPGAGSGSRAAAAPRRGAGSGPPTALQRGVSPLDTLPAAVPRRQQRHASPAQGGPLGLRRQQQQPQRHSPPAAEQLDDFSLAKRLQEEEDSRAAAAAAVQADSRLHRRFRELEAAEAEAEAEAEEAAERGRGRGLLGTWFGGGGSGSGSGHRHRGGSAAAAAGAAAAARAAAVAAGAPPGMQPGAGGGAPPRAASRGPRSQRSRRGPLAEAEFASAWLGQAPPYRHHGHGLAGLGGGLGFLGELQQVMLGLSRGLPADLLLRWVLGAAQHSCWSGDLLHG
jgi:hypothetical protein